MKDLERVYHPIWDWEENQFNMWGTVENRRLFLKKAIELTADHKRYGRFMNRVVDEWPISCENALTDKRLSKLAWIGHAACALAIECPEDITREAWGYLTDEQRLLANKEAYRAIKRWEANYRAGKSLLPNMGGALL